MQQQPSRPSSITPRHYPSDYWAATPPEQTELVAAARKALGPATQLKAMRDILKRAHDRGAMKMYSELADAARAVDDAIEICAYNDSVVIALSTTLERRQPAVHKRPYNNTRDAPAPWKSRPPPSARYQRREPVRGANGSAHADLDQPPREDTEVQGVAVTAASTPPDDVRSRRQSDDDEYDVTYD